MTRRPSTSPKHDEDGVVIEDGGDIPTTLDIDAGATLKTAGIYYVWGEIRPGGLKDIHQDVLLKHYLGPKRYNQPIQLVINSSGGDSDETSALIDLLSNVRFPVATAGFGTCASAGACLLACGTKGLRTVARNTSIMVHQYSWSASGKHVELVAHRHAQDAEYLKDVAFWLLHSKYRTRSEVEKHLLRKEDNWLTPKEAIRHGIVDRIGGTLQ
jgi:ATP-dependent Clp protease, protease subunit